MCLKKSHVIQKLAAVNLVYKSEIPLCSKVQEESEAVVISPNGFVACPLLVLAPKNLKLRKPVEYGVSDSCPGEFLLFNDRNICVKSIEIRLLLGAGFDCCIEVFADRFPRASAIGKGIPQEVRTCEVGGTTSGSKVDPVVAPSFAFANLSI